KRVADPLRGGRLSTRQGGAGKCETQSIRGERKPIEPKASGPGAPSGHFPVASLAGYDSYWHGQENETAFQSRRRSDQDPSPQARVVQARQGNAAVVGRSTG